MSDLVNIELPFAGFYESIHDSNIDRAIEDGFNYNYETDEDKEITDEEGEATYMADVDWGAIRHEYCKNFVEAFGNRFGLHLTFDELTSPQFYNFSTDRLFAKVPREEIDKIRKEVEAHKDYPEYIRERFTSRDGFWSNYSADVGTEEWSCETLDECQYRVILEFWLEHHPDVSDWNEEEWYLTNDFEMFNWDSVVAAHETIEKYLEEHKEKKHGRV